MNWSGLIRAFAPRILGGLASAAAGYVFVHTKGAVTLDPTQMVELGTTMITAYGVTHTGAAVKINPAAAASPMLATEGVEIKKDLQMTEAKH